MTNETLSPVCVVGAGALGCLFGGLLARAGAAVTLIGRPQHVAAIRRDGLRFDSRAAQSIIPVAATEDIAAVRGARLVLFCVKSSGTDDAAGAMAPHLARDAVIISMQNGVDNLERIGAQVPNVVLPGLVYVAAQMAGPGHVRHTGGGNLTIGRLDASRGTKSDRRLLEAIAELFAGAGIQVAISETIEVDLWTKLVMNCAYNAISALTGSQYGRMVALAEIRAVMADTVNEVVAVAARKGIQLPGDLVEKAIRLADGMPVTISSTAQDLLRGRRTEIDHLNGYVVRQGEALGVATPVNRTLNALVKLAESKASASPVARMEPTAPTLATRATSGSS
jgi:2-dehydropantoate 2-reductase